MNKKYLFKIGLICLVFSIVIEALIFNQVNSGASEYYRKEKLDLSKVITSDNIQLKNGKINIENLNDDTKLIFQDINIPTKSITILTKGSNEVVSGNIQVEDEGMKYYWTKVATFIFNPNSKEKTDIILNSKGELKNLMIGFEKANGSITIKSIILNDEIYKFNIIRFIILFLISFLLCIVIKFKIYEKQYNYEDKRNKFIFSAIICFLVIISIGVYKGLDVGNNTKNIEYKQENLGQNIYLYMFDSFMKKEPYLDIVSDTKFNLLENVYDRSERDYYGVQYMWDYAWYNGKYYSYYGLAPLFLVYFPYYFFTGMLPSSITVATIINIVTMIILVILLQKMTKLFKIKCNLLLMILGTIAVAFGSMLFSIQSCANQLYNINLCSNLCLGAFILCSINAYITKNNRNRIINLIFAGISIVLLVETRPNMLVACILFVLPLYLNFILDKKYKIKEKINCIIAFSVPIFIGGCFIMYYNYIRFGSISDFGKLYQLTAYDGRYFNITFSVKKIFATIYYYFLETPIFDNKFPFISLRNDPIYGLGKYYLKDPNMGILWIPLNLFLFLLPTIKNNKNNKLMKNMFLMGSVGSFICAYLTLNLGGAQLRYNCDFLMILLIISLFIMIYINNLSEGVKELNFIKYISYGICLLTIGVGFMVIFNNQLMFIKNLNPDLYIWFAKFFSLV